MNANYVYLQDLATEVETPEAGILSRTLHKDDDVHVMMFGFDTGQELSEHTASMPATLYFVQGEADLTLGADAMTAGPGTLAHMPAHLPHSVYARTPVKMLLMLHKRAGAG